MHESCYDALQIALCNVHIRHGLLMLVPEALEVLGGVVDELEAAHERLVQEVNKPPRGKRYVLTPDLRGPPDTSFSCIICSYCIKNIIGVDYM